MGARKDIIVSGKMAREAKIDEGSQNSTNVTIYKKMGNMSFNIHDPSTTTIMVTDEEAVQTSL